MPDLSAHLWHLPMFWLAAAEPAAMAGHLSEMWWKCTALTPRAAGPAGSSVQGCALSFSFVLEVNGQSSSKTISQNGPFILTWSPWLVFLGFLGFFHCLVWVFSCTMLRCLPAMVEGTGEYLATYPVLDVLQTLVPACSAVVKFGLDAHWRLGSLVTTVTTCHGWHDGSQCSTWPAVPVPRIKETHFLSPGSLLILCFSGMFCGLGADALQRLWLCWRQPEISVSTGSVLDQEKIAHCSQVKAALFWCKDPHLWRFLEAELPLLGIILVGDRLQLPPLFPFHVCDTGHPQGQEPWESGGTPCTALQTRLWITRCWGSFWKRCCGFEVPGVLCRGF